MKIILNTGLICLNWLRIKMDRNYIIVYKRCTEAYEFCKDLNLDYKISLVVAYKLKNLNCYVYEKWGHLCTEEKVEEVKDMAEKFFDSLPQTGIYTFEVLASGWESHGKWDKHYEVWTANKGDESWGLPIGKLSLEYDKVFLINDDYDKEYQKTLNHLDFNQGNLYLHQEWSQHERVD
jgi:hypothetical protein